MNVLKVLLSNRCIHNCLYCVNRVGHKGPRASFRAEELAQVFLALYHQGRVRGLFLSSAVERDSQWTMTEMIKVAELLRKKYQFRGYIHLKILPEVGADFIEEAVCLATRVSVNLEAPTPSTLNRIAPEKDFGTIWRQLEFLKTLREKRKTSFDFTTQFVVGAGGERDREIMKTAFLLYRKVGLARIYYSAFQPISGTPLEDFPPVSTWREHRLYQADFLFRKYGFGFEELLFDGKGNLPLSMDPKTTWALQHPEFFPIEINRASFHELIRVPGIGIVSAKRILEVRRQSLLSDPKILKGLGVRIEKALPFLLFQGKRFSSPVQLSLFPQEPWVSNF